jgi:predicted Zn-dependent peptidase
LRGTPPVTERYYVHEFDNGLVLLAEQLEHVVSTAMTMAIPMGASRDGAALAGVAGVVSEWMFRGAGGRDSRALNDALDSLGCQHEESVQSAFLQLSACQTYQNLKAVLELYADIARRANLQEQTFDPCLDLAKQELASLEDQPTRACHVRLREQFYPSPLGVSSLGTAQALSAMTHRKAGEHARRHLTPHGTILAVAGRLDWAALCDWVAECFASWTGPDLPQVATSSAPGGIVQQTKDTSQVQIGLAMAAPLIGEPHYYPARVAEMILSGGMSSRLVAEVREKRGLVYSVHARYQCLKGAAGMFVYAGTAPERAQDTLDVTVAELRRLGDGVTDEEIVRARTHLKSALIMQGESTAARSGGLVSDWHLLGRLRSLEEIAQAVEAVTCENVAACLAEYPATGLTAYVLGPKALDVTCLKRPRSTGR